MLGEGADGAGALLHGALEVGDAADDVDAQVEGAGEVGEAGRGAEEAVLREGDELEVEVGGDLGADVEQGLDAEEAVVGGVDVAADGEEAHGDGPVAVGERAVADFLDGGDLAELAPEGDAFEEGAGGVDAGEAVGERRVHVEVGVDEGRGDEVAGGVDGAVGLGVEAADGGDGVAGDADVGAGAVGEGAALDEEVEGHQRSPRL